MNRETKAEQSTKSHISIELDKSDVTAGETLRGKVVLVTGHDIPARGVRLELKGHESSIRHSGMGRSMNQMRETAVWFEDELTLFGHARTEVGSVLVDAVKGVFARDRYPIIERGEYTYDFHYQLPDTLPGNYESPKGDVAIRYELRAYVDIPLRVDIETTQKLTVYETTSHADDAAPADLVDDHRCLVPSGGHVLLKAHLDRHAYKLGEDIAVNVDLDNQCTQLVDGLELALELTETVMVHGEAETRHELIAVETFDRCKAAPKEAESYELKYSISPELYPTVDQGKLVKVSYALHVQAVVDLTVDPQIDIPIYLYEQPGQPGGQA